MKIIPAIDIIDGKCVRLSKGDYGSKIIYNENPLEVAKLFEDNGFNYLHIVDLDGAKSSKVVNFDILESISRNTNLKIDFGGGVKSTEDFKRVIDAGANQVTVGSIAVKNPLLLFDWIDQYGADRIILGADVKGLNIATDGWLETSDLTLFNFLKDYHAKGIKNVLCTDISKDGMLEGPAFELYSFIMAEYPDVDLIASGGVSCLEDVITLKENGIPSVVIGKAIYENKIDLKELVKLNTRQ
jgi:phosphoribosylformimino-5-aminoimidazole carboxamide ribotide isomerase